MVVDIEIVKVHKRNSTWEPYVHRIKASNGQFVEQKDGFRQQDRPDVIHCQISKGGYERVPKQIIAIEMLFRETGYEHARTFQGIGEVWDFDKVPLAVKHKDEWEKNRPLSTVVICDTKK